MCISAHAHARVCCVGGRRGMRWARQVMKREGKSHGWLHRGPPNAPLCVVYCCFWHAPGARQASGQVGLAPASALSLAWHGLAWPVCGVRRVRNNNLCRRLLCTVTPPSPLGRLGMLSLPGGGCESGVYCVITWEVGGVRGVVCGRVGVCCVVWMGRWTNGVVDGSIDLVHFDIICVLCIILPAPARPPPLPRGVFRSVVCRRGAWAVEVG